MPTDQIEAQFNQVSIKSPHKPHDSVANIHKIRTFNQGKPPKGSTFIGHRQCSTAHAASTDESMVQLSLSCRTDISG